MQQIFNGSASGLARSDVGPTNPAARASAISRTAALKRGFDVGAVTFALILFSPLLLGVAALVLLAQGRPVLIRHRRIGRSGVPFPCLKFRTMVVNSDEVLHAHIAANADAAAEWAATRKLKADPRVTPLGQIMRKLSIDEFPQLFNVLRGEMSLVGPRPIVQDEAHHYGPQIQLYHSMRPGLTGPWQIGGRSDVSYSHRVQIDADYVENWSFGRDLSILLKTVPAVMSSRGSY